MPVYQHQKIYCNNIWSQREIVSIHRRKWRQQMNLRKPWCNCHRDTEIRTRWPLPETKRHLRPERPSRPHRAQMERTCRALTDLWGCQPREATVIGTAAAAPWSTSNLRAEAQFVRWSIKAAETGPVVEVNVAETRRAKSVIYDELAPCIRSRVQKTTECGTGLEIPDVYVTARRRLIDGGDEGF